MSKVRSMPPKHPSYPFVEPVPLGVSAPQIEALADRKACDWGFRQDGSLDEVARRAGVDIEYSHYPNEIMLEVSLHDQPVIWLPRQGRKREDRVTIATALGHWALHVEQTRAAHPGCGIQALYDPSAAQAAKEAFAFSMAFLMPTPDFRAAWAEGRSQAASNRFDVPTKVAYLRAEALDLGVNI